jgi:hypothetical protein
VDGATRRQPQRWTGEEDDFYLAHVGKLSYTEIGTALGRTAVAVRIHAKRTGLPAATRVPGWLTTRQVSIVLGVDCRKPAAWVDAGLMAGERIAFEGQIVIRRVSWVQLKMWMIRPSSWVYFSSGRIKNAGLRRLVELAQQRWGDAWLTTNQVAELLGKRSNKDVSPLIVRGSLPAYQPALLGGRVTQQSWGYWFIKRSDLERYRAQRAGDGDWSPRADVFIRRMRSEGKSFVEIGRMMKWSFQRVSYRAKMLEIG